jgi:hypothetical protein
VIRQQQRTSQAPPPRVMSDFSSQSNCWHQPPHSREWSAPPAHHTLEVQLASPLCLSTSRTRQTSALHQLSWHRPPAPSQPRSQQLPPHLKCRWRVRRCQRRILIPQARHRRPILHLSLPEDRQRVRISSTRWTSRCPPR